MESFNDTTWLKDQLDQVGIPATIKVSEQGENAEASGPESGLFDLLVIDYHVMSALASSKHFLMMKNLVI